MKSSDRIIVTIIPVLLLVAAFWFLVLSPQRDEAAQLEEQVTALESEVQASEQAAEVAELSQAQFPDLYQDVVRLGKAVPEDDDTAALFTQITGIANQAGVAFRSIELGATGAGAPAPPPPAPPSEEDGPAEGEEGVEDGTEGAEDAAPEGEPATEPPAGATPVAATETSAALLPIGSAIGPAGFPVMRHQIQVAGGFFELSDFIRRMDRLVRISDEGTIAVSGRLMTIDGFTLSPNSQIGFPTLTGFLTVTTYLTDPSQGLTAGATPAGPDAAAQPIADGAPPPPPSEVDGGTP